MATMRKPDIGPWLFVSLKISPLIFNVILPEVPQMSKKQINIILLFVSTCFFFFLNFEIFQVYCKL